MGGGIDRLARSAWVSVVSASACLLFRVGMVNEAEEEEERLREWEVDQEGREREVDKELSCGCCGGDNGEP